MPPSQGVDTTKLAESLPADATKYATKSGPGSGPEQPPPADAVAGRAGLADVLRMIERLPLTDAEKADAVRRLLADAQTGG